MQVRETLQQMITVKDTLTQQANHGSTCPTSVDKYGSFSTGLVVKNNLYYHVGTIGPLRTHLRNLYVSTNG